MSNIDEQEIQRCMRFKDANEMQLYTEFSHIVTLITSIILGGTFGFSCNVRSLTQMHIFGIAVMVIVLVLHIANIFVGIKANHSANSQTPTAPLWHHYTLALIYGQAIGLVAGIILLTIGFTTMSNNTEIVEQNEQKNHPPKVGDYGGRNHVPKTPQSLPKSKPKPKQQGDT